MSKNKIIILASLVTVMAVMGAFVVRDSLKRRPAETSWPVPQTGSSTDPVISETPEPGDDGDPYREEAPVITHIPEANEVLPAAQQQVVAVPTVVVPAAPGVESNFRNFNISGEGGKFIPEKVIAKVGDTIHINFTAVDGDYDIVFPSYNMKQAAKKGQTKILEFQAVQDGSFVYYCESCGGLSSTAKGNIIIVE